MLPFEGLNFVTVKSRALRMRADMTLFVPEATPALGDVPLVVALHGATGSHWNWTVNGGAHRTARRLIDQGKIGPMVLAMPSDGLWGDGSAYLRHPTQDFERWIVEEVPAAALAAAPCLSGASPLFLCGLSMGGFGALRLGAKYPERFRGVSAHSSITHLEQMKSYVEEDPAGYGAPREDWSVLETMLRHRDRLPPFRFDCGRHDPLLKYSRELHRQLEEHHIAHIYAEFPGGHVWPYWETHFEDTLRFFSQLLPKTSQL